MFYHAPDGCRIHYDCLGVQGPRLMLIPGLGGDGRFWSGVGRDLAQDHRLIVADHRGAGRSDRPDAAYSIPLIAADMAGILRETGGAAHVVGHSTGGAVAQELALDHANLVSSLTISASWARADARFAAMFRARAALLEAGLAEAYQELTNVLGHTAEWMTDHPAGMEAAVREAAAKLAPLPVSLRRVRMLLDHDRLADLSRIAAPVQIVAADRDEMTPLHMSRAMADAIPGAALHVVSGAHFHPVATPEALSAHIRRFVKGQLQ